MKTVLYFGASGFLGTYFGRYLEQTSAGETVRVIPVIRRREFGNIGLDAAVVCDTQDQQSLAELFSTYQPSYVANFIGAFGSQTLEAMLEANVSTTKRIFDAILTSNCRPEKILVVGSAAEYGPGKLNPVNEDTLPTPANSHGITKFLQTCLATHYYSKFGLPVVIARTFNVLGRGASRELSIGNFEQLISDSNSGDTILVGDVRNKRDFLPAAEVVSRFWALLHRGAPGQIYNICSGKSIEISEILSEMIKESGKSLNVGRHPNFKKIADPSEIFGDSSKFDALVRLTGA